MKLFLVRHPETLANREGLVLGKSDSPLTARGVSVFRRVVERVLSEEISRVVSSPLPRALAGARIAADAFQCGLDIEPGLMELSCGNWEGRGRRELGLENTHIRRDWIVRPPGGESYRDAENRLKPVVDRIKSRIRQNPALVVGHSVVNRVFVKQWLNLDIKEALTFYQGFHEIYVLSPNRIPQIIAAGMEI